MSRETPVFAECVIALRRALICPDEHLFDVALGAACPVCGASECVPLSRWLPSVDERGAGLAPWVGSGR